MFLSRRAIDGSMKLVAFYGLPLFFGALMFHLLMKFRPLFFPSWPAWIAYVGGLAAAFKLHEFMTTRLSSYNPFEVILVLCRLIASVLLGILAFGAIFWLTRFSLHWAEWVCYGLALFAGASVFWGALDHFFAFSSTTHVRGRRLLSFEEVRALASEHIARSRSSSSQASPQTQRPLPFFGGMELPHSVETNHFSISGATGSGKTRKLILLMKSVLPSVGRVPDYRALVYDTKQDMVPILFHLGLDPHRIRLLNPFDKRSWAWDIALDIRTKAQVLQLVAALVPQDEADNSPFFTSAVRYLTRGVIETLMQIKRDSWDLRDVVNALELEREELQAFLSKGPRPYRFKRYFADERLYHNISATVATKMAPYEIIAALWEGRPKVSLRDWLDPNTEDYILVLGNMEDSPEALNAINRVLIQRMTEMVLAQTDDAQRRTWFFLDEVRLAGKLPLNSLMLKGRSKGAAVVLSFQDTDGMDAVYGEKECNEFLGQCGSWVVLKVTSPNTQERASRIFGKTEAEETDSNQSSGHGPGGTTSSSGTSTHVVERPLILPSEFDVPQASPENGIHGYCLHRFGAYYMVLPPNFVAENTTIPQPEDEATSGLWPRDADDQTVNPWTHDESRVFSVERPQDRRSLLDAYLSQSGQTLWQFAARGFGTLSPAEFDLQDTAHEVQTERRAALDDYLSRKGLALEELLRRIAQAPGYRAHFAALEAEHFATLSGDTHYDEAWRQARSAPTGPSQAPPSQARPSQTPPTQGGPNQGAAGQNPSPSNPPAGQNPQPGHNPAGQPGAGPGIRGGRDNSAGRGL